MSYLQHCLGPLGHAHLLWQQHKVYNSIGNKPQRVIGTLFSSLPLQLAPTTPCGRLHSPVRSAALCVCDPPTSPPPPPVLPHPLLGKLCCSLCVQLIDALTDFAVFVVVGFACDACEERNAPPAAWPTCRVACLPPCSTGFLLLCLPCLLCLVDVASDG